MTKEKFLEIITYIGNVIRHSHFENHVYAVGGSVRDFVMGNEIKDIDLVIDLPEGGIKFAEWIKDNQGLSSSVVVYPTYGTAMFHFYKYPEYEIECVMTRGEEYRDSKSRNPQVVYVPIEEDCIRRDLSINALYMNVSTKEIVDIIGGQEDIKNKVLRTTNPNPNVVFIDDPLRILRVVRFKSRYPDFNIDPLTFASMFENVDRL